MNTRHNIVYAVLITLLTIATLGEATNNAWLIGIPVGVGISRVIKQESSYKRWPSVVAKLLMVAMGFVVLGQSLGGALLVGAILEELGEYALNHRFPAAPPANP